MVNVARVDTKTPENIQTAHQDSRGWIPTSFNASRLNKRSFSTTK
jgi:hypothetical protein